MFNVQSFQRIHHEGTKGSDISYKNFAFFVVKSLLLFDCALPR